MADLAALLEPVTCVMFDFDGPVCRLFAGHPAAVVTNDLVGRLRLRGGSHLLSPADMATQDPHAVLRALDRPGARGARPGTGDAQRVARLVAELEALLTDHELRAAGSATPTAGAEEVIHALRATGRTLAITTNNSAAAVSSYLRIHGLLACFEPHIHGRGQDPQLLKPHPDSLLRALKSTGASAAESLMIGDTPADCAAARQAGVAFVGYARNEVKERKLLDAGATTIVTSMKQLLDAVGVV